MTGIRKYEITKIDTLLLNDNYIGPTGVQTLALEMLVSNSSVKTLELRNNSIDGWGASWLVVAMPKNRSLEYLSALNSDSKNEP